MESHGVGEPFVLIVPGALQEVVLPPFALGTAVAVTARGLADDGAQPVSRIVGGEAMKPPSPIDLVGQLEAGGGLALSWIRRSRLGWLWPAESEMPLGESSERYRVTLDGSAGTLTFETFQAQIIIAAEDLAGMTGPVMVSVVQVGDFAESRPATTSFVI